MVFHFSECRPLFARFPIVFFSYYFVIYQTAAQFNLGFVQKLFSINIEKVFTRVTSAWLTVASNKFTSNIVKWQVENLKL